MSSIERNQPIPPAMIFSWDTGDLVQARPEAPEQLFWKLDAHCNHETFWVMTVTSSKDK